MLYISMIVLCAALTVGASGNNERPIPSYQKGYPFDTRFRAVPPEKAIEDTRKKGDLAVTPILSDTIREPDAAWLRVFFKSSKLGKKCKMELTSLLDGSKQTLDSIRLQQWNNSSAFFNGDAIRFELFVDEEDVKNLDELPFVEVEGLMVESRTALQSTSKLTVNPNGICDDNRTPITSSLYCRLVPNNGGIPSNTVVGTAWVCPNGALVTAAHCYSRALAAIVEFNVPLSSSDGVIQHPGVEDQYAINNSTVVYSSPFGVGNDWAFFQTYRNTQSGLLPCEKQQQFFRITKDYNTQTLYLDVSGYGSTVALNLNNTLQQQLDGMVTQDYSSGEIDFGTFAKDGCSGTVIRDQNSSIPVSIGILGATELGGVCVFMGTSFKNTTAANKINRFPFGSNDDLTRVVAYLDLNHPSNQTRDGTILRPVTNFSSALNLVRSGANGGLIVACPGTYTGVTSISGEVTITSPCGLANFTP